MMKPAAKILLISVILLVSGCRQAGSSASSEDIPEIVATTGMLRDAVVQLAGDRAHVTTLMGPGVDPHLYQATPGDLAKLQAADLIVYNGLFLEGKLDDILANLSRTRNIVNYSDAMSRESLLEAADDSYEDEIYDPHVWFDIDLWIQGLEGLAKAMGGLYPEWEPDLSARMESYRDSLQALKAELLLELSAIPAEQRIMVTSHDAFRYFGRMLDVRVEALQGISTASEFGLQDRKQLVDLIVEEGIGSIFLESSVGDQPIRAILEDCRERGHEVQLGGTLFSDAMGEEGSAEGTYPGMLRHNVATLVQGLARE